jgi:hypothetical protein
MNQEKKKKFLEMPVPPALLTITETSWLLGFTEQDITVLVSAGLLKPLGHPPQYGSKYFATAELQTLRSDTRWLARGIGRHGKFLEKENAGRMPNQPGLLPKGES